MHPLLLIIIIYKGAVYTQTDNFLRCTGIWLLYQSGTFYLITCMKYTTMYTIKKTGHKRHSIKGYARTDKIIKKIFRQLPQQSTLKMNKLIFLTGLLTALLFIGTAHGGPYNEETSELEQQIIQAMMKDSTGAMETFDEEDNEMADEEDNEMANEMADVEYNEMAEEQVSPIVIAAVRAAGCAAAKAYCANQAIMMDDGAKIQGWRRAFRKVVRTVGRGFRKIGRFLKRALKKVGKLIRGVVTKQNFCFLTSKIC